MKPRNGGFKNLNRCVPSRAVGAPGKARRGFISHAEMHGKGCDSVKAGPRPGRNDPCPCESGDKFKRCCGR